MKTQCQKLRPETRALVSSLLITELAMTCCLIFAAATAACSPARAMIAAIPPSLNSSAEQLA